MVRRALTLLAVLAVIAGTATLGRALTHSDLARRATARPDSASPAPSFRPLFATSLMAGTIRPPPSGSVYWGVFRDGAPYNADLLYGLEKTVGRRPAIVMWYQEWDGRPAFPAADAAFLADRGIVPMISWEPWKPPAVFGDIVDDQPAYRLARIAAGDLDEYITSYALEIRAFGGPVLLRPFHEMDGYWYPWNGTVNGNTPEDFVAAWRHVHQVFRRAGATNVTWVWSVNHVSVPNSPRNQIRRYWPGPSYVDWVGVSGFNWGRASPLSVWKGLDTVLRDRYRELLAFHKPIALTETGAPEIGGNKEAWIRSTFATALPSMPGIRAVIWYDKRDSVARDWRIDSSFPALRAFKAAVAGPRVLSADAALATTDAERPAP